MKKDLSKRFAVIAPLLLLLVLLLIGAGFLRREKAGLQARAQAQAPQPENAHTLVSTPPLAPAEKVAAASRAGVLQPIVPGQPPAPQAVAPGKGQALELYRPAGATTGQPLEPKSAVYVQAQLAGRKLEGRVTPLDPGMFTSLAQVRQGEAVSIPLTDSQAVTGVVNLKQTAADGLVSVGGALAGQAGSFFFEFRDTQARGEVLLPAQGLAYRLEQEAAGALLLREVLLTDVVCAQTTESPPNTPPPGQAPAPTRPEVLAASPPPVLSSRPTATAQIYLDFDGETVTDAGWNSGNTIVAQPADLTESQITEIYEQVKEDFWPFNINVTTDISKYDAAPVGLRMRCIITPTNTASGGAPLTLGIAKVNVFNSTLRTIPCWAFTHDVSTFGIGGVGVTISHEIGHTLGLTHDGVTTVAGDNYFVGQGQGRRTFTAPAPYVNEANNRYALHWGPIMGSPTTSFQINFPAPIGLVSQRDLVDVSHWSKGEYQDANNTQDDVAVISSTANGFGYAADEAGGTRDAAAALLATGTTVGQSGTITQATDVDVFSFTTTGGAVSLGATLSPAPNLDVALEIQNAAGTVVASANPSGSQTATLSTTLAAGNYYLKVSGSGDGNALTDGYTSYGSTGAYTLTGTISGYVPSPELALEQPAGTLRASGSTRDFGGVTLGGSSTLVFTVKNTGDQALNLSSVALTGGDAARFSLNTSGMATSLNALTGETTFSVTFTPAALVFCQTTLRLQSDDPDEGTYDVLLTGTGATASVADTTQAHFTAGTATNLDLTTTPGDVVLSLVNQRNTDGFTGGGFGFSTTSWAGQTFVPTATGLLSRVDLGLFAAGVTGTTPDIVVSIRATSGSPAVPTGADLATATITGFSAPSLAYYQATFASPPTVTAGTTYAVIFRAATAPSAGTYAYGATRIPDTNPYAAGQMVTSGISGLAWTPDTTAGGRDLLFKVYVGNPYPTAGDLISTVKDSAPGAGLSTTWTTLGWTATTPAGTSVKFHLAGSASPTGPFDFVGPDGTAASFFTTSGAALTQFRGFRYLKYRAFLATTDPAVTPTLSDVTLNYYHGTFSSSANLASLTLGTGTLTPAFDPATTSYTASVPNATTSLTFTATPEAGASLSGPASPLSLSVGANTLSLLVTAEDGTTTKGYSVTLTRRTAVEDTVYQWAVSSGLAPADAAPNADADGDGVSNLLEFAFGTNPGVSSIAALQRTGTFAGGGSITQTGQPVIASEAIATGTDFRAVFVRRNDHASAGLVYSVQFSADVTTWQTSAATPSVLADDGVHQIVSVPYPFFIGGKKARFFRVRVDTTP